MVHLTEIDESKIYEWLDSMPPYDADPNAWLPTAEELTDVVFPLIQMCESDYSYSGITKAQNMIAVLFWISEAADLEPGVAQMISEFVSKRLPKPEEDWV